MHHSRASQHVPKFAVLLQSRYATGIPEREAELSVLANGVRTAAGRPGSVALVMGEAGIGKSSLVEALRSHLPAEGKVLVGYCDGLATPPALGPFRDLVGSVGTELSHAVADGSDWDRVLAALRGCGRDCQPYEELLIIARPSRLDMCAGPGARKTVVPRTEQLI
jgi:AAA ATPase domain